MSVLFVFLLIENILEKYIVVFQYSDELISIVLFLLILIRLPHAKLPKTIIMIIIFFLITLLLGILSSAWFHIQPSRIAAFKDILAVSKFFIVYVYAAAFASDKNAERERRRILSFSRFYIWILAFCGVVNQFVDLGMGEGYRGPIKEYAFLYSHGTFMVASVVVMAAVFIANGTKKNAGYIGLSFLVLALSMRIKAFIFIAAACTLMFGYRKSAVQSRRSRASKNSLRLYMVLAIVLVLVYFIARNKVASYLSWGAVAARPALYIVGFQIMCNYFPLGSGLGTFASSISGEYYSPLYFTYGISNVSGLRQSEGFEYMADTYWPYIFGQYGLIGMTTYLLSLYCVFRDIRRVFQSSPNAFSAALSMFFYVIASSFVEAVFTNATIVLIALTLGYYLRISRDQETSGTVVS